MRSIFHEAARPGSSAVFVLAGLTLAVTVFAPIAEAQTPPAEAAPANTKPADTKSWPRKIPDTYETLYLVNSTQQNDLNDIQTAMRNVLPNAHIYGDPSQHSISLWATQEDIALAHKILADLDKKKPTYRLTYTLTEMDGGKKVQSQSFALVAVAGEKAELRQGNRVPLVTGSVDDKDGKPTTQVQYIDVGMNLEATVDGYADGVRIRTKVEQSSVAEEKSGIGAQDPVIRQSRLESTATLVTGKPVVLGSMSIAGDTPGSTRHLEVEVVSEVVK